MELHQLRYFAALAETHNYTAAAERCYVSRQALRQAVQSMEREYGAVLVENRRNRLYLTPAGELLAFWSGKICADLDDMNADLRRFMSEPLRLRLGVSVSLLPLYAPEQLEKIEGLRTVFPTLTIESVLLDADSILRQLREGELDAAILVDMGTERKEFLRTVLRRDSLGILVPSTHPYQARKSLRLRDLDGQTLSVMSAPEDCFGPLYEALRAADIHVRYRVIHEPFDAFTAVRRDGILAIDRLEIHKTELISIEKDLPLLDFKSPLETVFLVRRDSGQNLKPLLRYLQNSL